MSLNLHDCINDRRYYGIKRKHRSQHSSAERIYSDKFIMSQMTLERELEGHSGCVNTLDWSLAGDRLLSGSDDTKLNIYHPFDNYKLVHSINTGHHANIFIAKFMPQTSDNVIISGAGDSEIRIFDLNDTSKSNLDSMYVCHSDQVKKVCVYDNNPFEFLTCSQDGTVRHFDRRVPHICSPHNVRSFITAQSKPARQHPLPTSKNIKDGCSRPIVDYSKHNIELNSMDVNKIFPHYFIVAGMNDYIYLHDRRMLPSSTSSTLSSNNIMDSLKCIKRFSPTLDGVNRPNKHITACKFSQSNGYEIIGSWSSDSIYLFNMNDSPIEPSHSTFDIPKSNNYLNNEPFKKEESEQKKLLWNNIFRYFDKRDLDLAYTATSNLFHFLSNYATPSLETTLGKICALLMQAVIICHRRTERDDWYTNSPYNSNDTNNADEEILWNRYFFESELNMIEEKIQESKSLCNNISSTWQSWWALSIGYWALTGGYRSISGMNRKTYIEQSSGYISESKRHFYEKLNLPSNPQDRQIQEHEAYTQLDNVYLEMLNLFPKSFDQTKHNERYDILNAEVPWEKLMYISIFSPKDIRQCLNINEQTTISNDNPVNLTDQQDQSLSEDYESIISSNTHNTFSDIANQQYDNDSSDSSYNSSNSNNDSIHSQNDTNSHSHLADVLAESSEDEIMNDDEMTLYTRIMSRHIMDIYRRGSIENDSDDSDLDLEELAVFRDITQQYFQSDVDVIGPSAKYTGHCNIETIKDVDFFGLNDEYIVSGSDGGYLFVWDKKLSKIVQILQADNEIVNVVKGHPTLPIMAVSGIDSTIKIFTPTSRLSTTSKIAEPNSRTSYSTSSRMYEEEEIISVNQENNQSLGADIYITRSMIAALSRISRQHQLRILSEIDSDDNDDSDINEED